MKRIKASMTAEASILLPFVIIISIVIMYLCVYVYDRALMVSDVNMLASVITDASLYNKDKNSVLTNEYETIKEEHPYMSLTNMELKVEKNGSKTIVGLSGDWELPIFPGYNQKLEYKKEVTSISPIASMYAVKGVKDFLKEKENANSDDI